MTTGGFGETGGDDRHVYTISLGRNAEGPVRLLALAREDSRTVWQSMLPDAAIELDHYDEARVSVGSRMIAARVGSRVFVLPRAR